MRPYTTASIYASVVAFAIALVGALEAFDRTQRGYRLTQSFLLEAAATTAFYFILVFVLVAKFPTWPTKGLLALRNTFTVSSLRTPTHRLSFIVMCIGMVVVMITSAAYYLNGHESLLEYWFGGRRWAPRAYSTWLWAGLLSAVVGLLGSFLHDAVVKPVVQWVRGDSARDSEK